MCQKWFCNLILSTQKLCQFQRKIYELCFNGIVLTLRAFPKLWAKFSIPIELHLFWQFNARQYTKVVPLSQRLCTYWDWNRHGMTQIGIASVWLQLCIFTIMLMTPPAYPTCVFKLRCHCFWCGVLTVVTGCQSCGFLTQKCHNCACLALGYAHASRRRALDKLSTVPAGEHGEPYQNQFNRILQDCLVSACKGK